MKSCYILKAPIVGQSLTVAPPKCTHKDDSTHFNVHKSGSRVYSDWQWKRNSGPVEKDQGVMQRGTTKENAHGKDCYG
jgi:hypothetical protein